MPACESTFDDLGEFLKLVAVMMSKVVRGMAGQSNPSPDPATLFEALTINTVS